MRFGAYLLLAVLVVPWQALAQEPASPATRLSGIVVREWLILVSDPFQSQASIQSLFNDTLPDFVQTRRPRAAAAARNRPSPIGVIRISAPLETKLDVQIDARNGAILSTWPVSRARGNAAMWRDVTVVRNARSVAPLDEQHWLNVLRQGNRPFLFAGDRTEKFLLYDVVLPFTAQLSLAPGTEPGTVKLAHAGYSPLRDLVFYRPDGAQAWNTATLATLDPPPGATPPRVVVSPTPTAAAVTAAQQTRALQEAQIRQQIALLQARQQALLQAQAQGQIAAVELQAMIAQYQTQMMQLQTQLPQPPPVPVVNPSAVAEKPGAMEVQLVRSSSANLTQLLADWKERLARYDLDDSDVNLILRILQLQIEESPRLTAIYRLDDPELARLLPLEVVPAPADMRRVALVVVKNIDPGLPTEIDGLIARLGDRDWKTREAATQTLAAIGPAARAKLQSALTNRDAEVALRAERLLAALNVQQGQPSSPAPVLRGNIIAF